MRCKEFVFRFHRRTVKARTLLVGRVLVGAVRRLPRVHRFAGKAFDGPVLPVAV